MSADEFQRLVADRFAPATVLEVLPCRPATTQFGPGWTARLSDGREFSWTPAR